MGKIVMKILHLMDFLKSCRLQTAIEGPRRPWQTRRRWHLQTMPDRLANVSADVGVSTLTAACKWRRNTEPKPVGPDGAVNAGGCSSDKVL